MIITRMAQYFPDAVFFAETLHRQIALTIDDAPTQTASGASTCDIVGAIAHYNKTVPEGDQAQATFFVLGQHLEAQPHLLAELLAHGHEIGNHGWSDLKDVRLSAPSFAKRLQQTHQRILQEVSTPLRWYRPSYGFYKSSMVATLRQMPGYYPQFVLASMLPLDARRVTQHPRLTAAYLARCAFPGAILLLHDGTSDRAYHTAQTLRLLLPALHRQGYRITTLSALMFPLPHHLGSPQFGLRRV